jgi:O-Antigen ligase
MRSVAARAGVDVLAPDYLPVPADQAPGQEPDFAAPQQPVAVFRPHSRARLRSPAALERSQLRRVGLTWGLLVLNALTWFGSALPIPGVVGKLIQQGSLPLALLLALTLNPRLKLRPNVLLSLACLLVAESIVTSLDPQYFGSIYRTIRLAEFVAALWLLTPWWGRRDLLLVRYHLITYGVCLVSVILGVFVSPGQALGEGRLAGTIWDMPPTQVAHYAAVTIGLVVVLWLCGKVTGRFTLIVSGFAGIILVLTHTRTALIGMMAGILIAGLSLIVAKARVRKLFAAAGVTLAVALLTLSGLLATWLARGEGTKELTDLTGRTEVWGPLLALPRTPFQMIFGFGLSNSSFNGLSIDSNWLASYDEQGLFGVAICALILIFLFAKAYSRPRSVQRALALFLITYCLVASFTEVGFTDVSTYLLELTLAASLLVPAAEGTGSTVLEE